MTYDQLVLWIINHVPRLPIDQWLMKHTRHRLRGSLDFYWFPIVGKHWWARHK